MFYSFYSDSNNKCQWNCHIARNLAGFMVKSWSILILAIHESVPYGAACSAMEIPPFCKWKFSSIEKQCRPGRRQNFTPPRSFCPGVFLRLQLGNKRNVASQSTTPPRPQPTKRQLSGNCFPDMSIDYRKEGRPFCKMTIEFSITYSQLSNNRSGIDDQRILQVSWRTSTPLTICPYSLMRRTKNGALIW